MNEVTKIHLGRQAFSISIEAHKDLKNYLDAIKQVSGKDVASEVELRMTELLAEHGVTGDKVILPADVEFLKDQLGEPSDFTDEEKPNAKLESGETKRLFRDTDNAMVGGVAAGLAQYFGVDVLLVRLLFVLFTFTGGSGILIYLVLWLLVPEAKTSSDRLQMAGKPVTVDSLKEVVERADVKSKAERASHAVMSPLRSLSQFILKVIGASAVFIALCFLFGFAAVGIYFAVHSGNILGQDIFPIGLREHVLVYLALAVSGLTAVLGLLLGIAIFKQKWPIKIWLTGVLIGLILIGFAGSVALGLDVAPQVNDRYNAHTHTTIRQLDAFDKVNAVGDGVTINYKLGDKYSASLNYFDQPDLSQIKTTVTNGTLLVDSTNFNWRRNCPVLCIPPTYNVVVTITSPQPVQAEYLNLPDAPVMMMPTRPYKLYTN